MENIDYINRIRCIPSARFSACSKKDALGQSRVDLSRFQRHLMHAHHSILVSSQYLDTSDVRNAHNLFIHLISESHSLTCLRARELESIRSASHIYWRYICVEHGQWASGFGPTAGWETRLHNDC